MTLISFTVWKINEGKFRSQESELECPHKNDKDFCREWKKYLNGERDDDPLQDPKFLYLKSKPRLGHFERRSNSSPTRKNVMRRKALEGKGRYKWRDSGEN